MKYLIKILIIIALCGTGPELLAQNFSCGTVITPARKAYELNNLISPLRVPVTRIDKEFCIYAHILRRKDGTYVTDTAAVRALVDDIESAYEPIGAKFKFCLADTMYNWQWDTLFVPYEESAMMTVHYKPDIINIFFVGTIMRIDSSTVAGYAAMPGGDDYIVLEGAGSTGVLIHEMGHFLGLYHTHETDFGPEHPSMANCATAGDLLCDTEADPFPIGNIDNCEVTGTGLPYLPPVDNYMSYWECACRFTNDQYSRMATQYWLLRTNLW